MISASLISQQLFILGVTAVAILPRLPSDKTRWSIGSGNVGYPFRRLLLVLAGLNLLHFVLSSSKFIFIASVLKVSSIIAHNFLCLLTPYLLQKWLASCINIQPGRDLTRWLWAVSLFGVAGVYLSSAFHPRFFALEELAHAMSCIPVISTLKTYNRVTTPGHGRGTVMSQTVLLVEYWHIVSQITCAIGYAFGGDSLVAEMGGGGSITQENSNQIAALLRALREGDFMTDWSRVLVHAIFMNQLDELSFVRVSKDEGVRSYDEERGGGRQDSPGGTMMRTELATLSKK
mmetsp:Transcript_26696/g.57440  ORF Transcript_26696/g.57440 Transcript_26696/m.57440 type:complete len:289 (-) Transcript_26696:46-912(-)